jgi:Fe2+ transport protein
MKLLPSLLCLAAAALLAGCGEDSEQAAGTGTGTSGTVAAASSEDVPEGVRAEYSKMAEEIAHEGGDRRAGDWLVGYLVEGAEGWFERRDGELRWRAPVAGETHHIEILPREADSGRLVPDVSVTLEVVESGGKRVARKPLRFYHAEFFHYAENFALPSAGRYTLKATIGPPPFRRHGERDEAPPLQEGATVTFADVEIEDA